ncbi:RNA polymerase sigma factor [Corallococcus sp. Z5C101001]|nr:sigma-70 family RNA polymerase sigma factor [Corallococcus silvisoli]TSC24150.1 RNA polymerase sigma factor [Corallococcus sp. Z5C101001]
MREELDRSDMEYADFAVRHQPILMAICRKLCGTRGRACDDLVQDVLLRALLKWDTLQHDPEPERRAWLVRVLHSRFLDQCRGQSPQPAAAITQDNVHTLFEEPDAPPPELWDHLTEAQFREAVSALPYNLRRTFELQAEGLRHEEIGRRLGAPATTVGSWLFHARHQLRDQLRAMAEARRDQAGRER